MYIFQSTCFHKLVLHLHSYLNAVLQIMAACMCVCVRAWICRNLAWPNLLSFCTYYICTNNASVLIAFFIFDFHVSFLSLSLFLIASYGLIAAVSLPFSRPALLTMPASLQASRFVGILFCLLDIFFPLLIAVIVLKHLCALKERI